MKTAVNKSVKETACEKSADTRCVNEVRIVKNAEEKEKKEVRRESLTFKI